MAGELYLTAGRRNLLPISGDDPTLNTAAAVGILHHRFPVRALWQCSAFRHFAGADGRPVTIGALCDDDHAFAARRNYWSNPVAFHVVNCTPAPAGIWMTVERAAEGLVTPATGGDIPLGMPGYRPEIAHPFDLQQARQILAAEGYPDGKGLPPLTAAANAGYNYWKDVLVVPHPQETAVSRSPRSTSVRS